MPAFISSSDSSDSSDSSSDSSDSSVTRNHCSSTGTRLNHVLHVHGDDSRAGQHFADLWHSMLDVDVTFLGFHSDLIDSDFDIPIMHEIAQD